LQNFGFSKAKKEGENERINVIKQMIKCRSYTNIKSFPQINEKVERSSTLKKSIKNKGKLNSKTSIKKIKISLNSIKNIDKLQNDNSNNRLKDNNFDDGNINNDDNNYNDNNYNEDDNGDTIYKEKVINIELKNKRLKCYDDLYNNFTKKLDSDNLNPDELIEIPSEIVAPAQMVNPIFNIRQNYYKTFNLKRVDLAKSRYSMELNPLSVYDLTNVNKFINEKPLFRKTSIANLNHPSTSLDFTTLDPENNPLKRRQIITRSKEHELDRIKLILRRKNITIKDLNSKILPPDNFCAYSYDFLPKGKV